ncbi:MAG: aspartate/glutamate racemase family protein [Lachnospiraceae bacterium]|jgi:aspartate racemase|nr:aspartate/glutamate racemase family protein [Lachnospiraceae bacterium]
MNVNSLIIGIVGGMGPLATVDLFRRLVEAFPSERDWEKPHIIVDSYSTIPSRVRAVLYDEKKSEVVDCLAASIRHLQDMGAQKIIVGCHTAHIFLPEVLSRLQCREDCVLNIIDSAVIYCAHAGYRSIRLLASEGTVQTKIYTMAFERVGIDIINPTEEEQIQIRSCIEAVKQNLITDEAIRSFQNLIKMDENPVLLGCSELPVMYESIQNKGICFGNDIIDPFQIVIDDLSGINEIKRYE